MHPLHQQIQKLKSFAGSPGEFWIELLGNLRQLAGAETATMMRVPDVAAGRDWQPLSRENGGIGPFSEGWRLLADRASEHGVAHKEHRLAVSLDAEGKPAAVALFTLPEKADAQAIGMMLCAYSDLPDHFLRNKSVDSGDRKAARFATVLDLGLTLQAGEKFGQSGMQLCNELASRFGADRVSLGWLRGRAIKVAAISHTEKIEKRAEIVSELEAAMEEAIDQDDEIVFPPGEKSSQIDHHHRLFANKHLTENLVSVPLRDRDRQRRVGVLTLERKGRPFREDEVEVLRLASDFLGPILSESEVRSRWFGSRWAAGWRRSAAGWLGFENTWWKLAGVSLGALLIFLFLFRIEHKVKATFVLRSTATAQIPAPFDGFISDVHVQVGERVSEGETLVGLDVSDLLLQEAETRAEEQRFLGEARSAEAAERPSLMRIADFQSEQSRARRDIVKHRMEQAAVTAPFDGIIVEGDLRERIAAPVQRGELLLRLVKIEGLYAAIKVEEKDIVYLKDGAACQMAFTSLPEVRFDGKLEPLDPVPESTDTGTVFRLRAGFNEEGEDWWRPGMSGVCKINAGKRSLMWILTHRTIDFLRMFFWI
ncbi:MAG: efflux RND transporter periplasmic adaptor subunit [Verrucomicrobiae bacterium]|nr:efflux RND transporter periplasmic adaptor subunit [Verrucomicrobiae bacterium]